MPGPLSDELIRTVTSKLAGDQLVLFVGAGISYQARSPKDRNRRIPLWRDLALTVAQHHGETIDDYSGNLLEMFDGISSSQGRRALEDSVRTAVDDANFLPSRTHELIASLPWHMVFTTNYDSLLRRCMGDDAIVSESDYEMLRRPKESRPRLIHLHGDLGNMHTLTGEDYSLWEEKHPIAAAFLKEVGLTKTFFFIGYSNSDPHLRYGLFPWIRKLGKGRDGRNYALMWNVSFKQIRVLDRVSRIDVTSLGKDIEWEEALEQIKLSYYDSVSSSDSEPIIRKTARKSLDLIEPSKIYVNGYKLFYYRTIKRVSVSQLAKESGVHYRRIKRLERVSKSAISGKDCFASSSRGEIEALEQALGSRGQLQFGSDDDFLASYIMYYKANNGVAARPDKHGQLPLVAATKAVVFDFGGTLTLPSSRTNTWERIWLSVGYNIVDAAELHRQFAAGKITHQEWCNLTRDKLRSKGFSRRHLEEIATKVVPIPGLETTFKALLERAIPIYIVSGSIKSIIVSTLGALYSLVEETKCNDILFDENGLVKEIRGHDFDFEGKARFISRVIEARRCAPLEVLFVGNSLNDHWAIKSGARTLCVNPSHTDFTNSLVWSNYIKDMDSLTQILDHV